MLSVMPRTETLTASDRRNRLLDAGLEAFGSTPYDDVAVSELARRANVAAGLPFHYFGSKRGYYLAVLGRVAEQMSDVLQPDASLEPRAAIRAMLQSHVRWMGGHAQHLRELIRGGLGGDPEVRVAFDDARWDGASRLLGAIGVRALEPGARLFVGGWIALKDEVILAWVDADEVEPSEEELIESLVGLLVHSLLCVPSWDESTQLAIESIR